MLVLAGPWSRLVTPPAVEPLTLEEGKLWAGFDWPTGDPREALMTTVIAASRAHVEDDTTLALLTQTRETGVYASAGAIVVLPPKCRPVQSVESLTWVDGNGDTQTIDPSWYAVDPGTGYLTLSAAQTWPTAWLTIRVVVGWASVAALTAAEPRLIHLVGRLTAHNMTLGRDHAISGTIVVEVPMGYDVEIQPYRPEILA